MRITLFIALSLLLSLAHAASIPDEIRFNRDVRLILSENCFQCHGPDEKTRKAGLRLDDRASALADHDGVRAIVPGTLSASELIARITHSDPDEKMPPAKSERKLSERDVAILKRWVEQGAAYESHWAFLKPERPGSAPDKDAIDFYLNRKLKAQGLQAQPQADRITLIRRLYFDLTGLPPPASEVKGFVGDQRADAYEQLVDRLLTSPHYGERMAIYWLDVVRFADSNGYHSDEARQVAPFRDYVIKSFNENKRFDRFVTEQLAGDLLPEASEEQKVASGFNMLLQTTNEGGAQAKEYLAKYSADRVRNTSTIFLGVTMGCAECHDHKFDPFSQKDFYSMAAIFADIKEAGKGNPPSYPVSSPSHQAELQELDVKIAALKEQLAKPSPEIQQAQQAWENTALKGAKDLPVFSGWHQLGPFKGRDFNEAHDKAWIPETEAIDLEQAQGKLKWQKKPKLADGKVHTLTGANAATYLYRTLLAQDAQPLKLSLGSDDGFQIWVNGQLVKNHKVSRGVAPDQDTVTVQLKPGENTLLMKVSNGGGGYGFYFKAAGSDLPKNVYAALKVPKAQRNPAQQKAIDDYYRSISPALIGPRNEIAGLENQRAEMDKKRPRTLMTVSTNPRPIRILPRGNWMDDSGPEMKPAIPELFGSLNAGDRVPNRLDFAQWITARDNPLTARAFMNRAWKLFYGQGLSRRLDDLGSQGDWPSHPELLDWLSVEFMESRWDVKHMIKLLVSSDAYKRVSTDNRALRSTDPENRYYARQSRWLLEAEMVRDNALSISGLLVDKIGGLSVKPYQPAGYWRHMNFPRRSWKQDEGEELYRRGLYTWWQRMFLHPSMVAFDAPSREEACAERPRSNTPQQALVLLNDPAYVEAARMFAEKIMREGGKEPASRLEYAFQSAVSRSPMAAERKVMLGLLEKHTKAYRADVKAAEQVRTNGMAAADPDVDAAELAAWTSISRVILNLHETITRR